jgi:hypothetical protein
MWGSLSRRPSEGRQPGTHFFAVEEVPCVQRGHFGSPLRRCRLMPSAVTIEDLLNFVFRRQGAVRFGVLPQCLVTFLEPAS